MAKSNEGRTLVRLRQASKHWANFLRSPPGSLKERHANKAEDRFFEWLRGAPL